MPYGHAMQVEWITPAGRALYNPYQVRRLNFLAMKISWRIPYVRYV